MLPGLNAHAEQGALWRRLERVLFERLVLTALLLVAFSGLAALGLGTACRLLSPRRREQGPWIFFPGWERLGGVVGVSLLLPVAAYFLLTRLTGACGPAQPIAVCGDRIVLEVVALGAVICVLSLTMAYRALRMRMLEAGLAVPPRGAFRPQRGWLLMAGLALGLLAAYAAFHERPAWRGRAGYYVAEALGVIVAGWFMDMGRRFIHLPDRLAPFRKTWIRCFVPVLALLIILFGALAHSALKWEERALLQRTRLTDCAPNACADAPLAQYRRHCQTLYEAAPLSRTRSLADEI